MSRPIHDPGANWVETDRVQPLHKGLSLRDYFAAKAMQGLMGRAWGELPPEELFKTWATSSYAVADAMLKAMEET
jgi:hypothetical protein